MSPKATEGVGTFRRDATSYCDRGGWSFTLGDPSGLRAISPSRGEISSAIQTFGMSSRLLHYVGA